MMDKREKSIRLMNKRLAKLDSSVNQLANLSTSKYSYTEGELENMISTLKKKNLYAVGCLERRKELNMK
jgi:flagellar basal body rod protein FlgG